VQGLAAKLSICMIMIPQFNAYTMNQNFIRVVVFSVICRKLHQMNLIDQSYSVEEFEFMRGLYQTALFHLFSVAKSVSAINDNETNLLLPHPR
jgi:hypothetical protein